MGLRELILGLISQAAWFSQTVAWFYRSRRMIATCTVAVLVSLLAFHVIFGANGMIVYQQKRTENKALDAEIKSLQAENERLNDKSQPLPSRQETGFLETDS